MADLVEFVCPRCGPVLETFASAQVTCSCGRLCRLPEWARAQRKRRAVSRSRHRGAGQGVAVSQNRRLYAVGAKGLTGDRGGAA